MLVETSIWTRQSHELYLHAATIAENDKNTARGSTPSAASTLAKNTKLKKEVEYVLKGAV
jgi:hypothetical protein